MNNFSKKLNSYLISKKGKYEVNKSDIKEKDLTKNLPVLYTFEKGNVLTTEDFYIVGPYKSKEHDNIIGADKYLKRYKVTDCVLPCHCSIIVEDGYYIAYNNIKMTGYNVRNNKITVNNVTLVNKLLPNKGIYESTAFRNYILACCICYSLRVGVNFMESLYDTKKKTIHIINTGKIVAKERNDEYFYFSKKIPQAFNMYSYTFNIHKEIIKDLEELEDVSTTYRRNISECIESLKKYSDKVIVTKSTEVLTYSGYKIDEAKSGLQKYLRFQDTNKAVKCLIELLRLKDYNIDKFLSRIIVEEIGLADPNLVIYYLKKLVKGGMSQEDYIDMIYTLSKAGSSKTVERLQYLHLRNIEAKCDHDADKYIRRCERTFNFDTDNIIKNICLFEYWYLKCKKDKCVHYINIIYNLTFSSNIKAKVGKERATQELWYIMREKTKYAEDIYDAYKKDNFAKVYITFCALLNILVKDYKYKKPDIEKGDKYYKYLRSPYKLKLDDDVFDYTTKSGRDKGFTKENYIKEFIDVSDEEDDDSSNGNSNGDNGDNGETEDNSSDDDNSSEESGDVSDEEESEDDDSSNGNSNGDNGETEDNSSDDDNSSEESGDESD